MYLGKIREIPLNVSGFIIQNGTRGIYMEYSNNSTISGNTITVIYGDGIGVYGSSGNTIRDNFFQSNGITNGITIYGNNIG